MAGWCTPPTTDRISEEVLNADDLMARTATLRAGAVFHRCALQVNPQHYSATFRGRMAKGDARSHADAVIAQARDLDVSVLAITDHNDVSGVQVFQNAAADSGITIFPGFELASSEGIHVLCIYSPGTDEEVLGRFLGEFGIRDPNPSSQLSSQSFEQILSTVREQRGISVAAHITNEKGLLGGPRGQSRIKAWRNQHLLAVQIPGEIEDLPPDAKRIVRNRDPNYRREHGAGKKLAVAVVNAADVTQPADLEESSATCWIKMSEVSIEGLRQAFLDPGSRIRLNPQRASELAEHGELVAIGWEGGFLDGVAVPLNSNLNVLVGGRGAGKSTVIESLRYVLDLRPLGEDAQKAHDGIVRQVLRNGTRVSVVVRQQRPGARQYRIDRTVPNPPVVRDEEGQLSSLLPAEILPGVEVYGQHEISELTRGKEKLTSLLDRFVEHDSDLAGRKASVRRGLKKTRRSILELTDELARIDERLATLPGLQETLERYQEAGIEDRLRERSLLVREERVLESVPERLRPLRDALENLRQEIPIDRLFLSTRALEDLPGREILAGADGILARLTQDVEAVATELDAALARADKGMAAIQSRWNERKREVQRSYEKILRELQKSAVDGEEFIRLRREIEGLRPLRDQRLLRKQQRAESLERRRTLLAEWEDLKAEGFRSLERAAKRVSRKLRDRVQVEVTASGDRQPLFEVLRSDVGGRLSEAIGGLSTACDLSLPQFVEACRRGADAVQQIYSLPPTQAARLADATPEALMRIEELELLPTTTIRLNTAPAGEPPAWQALENLSTGQKATAVLLLLLLDSDAPLIVDQPEDDLDNRFITEGVVPRMRAEKRRRQFIFSTHNANIPVLGDAELILGLTAGSADDGQARIDPKHVGSIDTPSVQELVGDILEGGREAFEKRRLKYGF